MNTICVYVHVNPIKQEIFYVGIGEEERPYSMKRYNEDWNKVYNEFGCDVIILHENLSPQQACELEVKYIAQIGRADKGLGTLTNHTNGGDGIKQKYGKIYTRSRVKRNKAKETKEKSRKKHIDYLNNTYLDGFDALALGII